VVDVDVTLWRDKSTWPFGLLRSSVKYLKHSIERAGDLCPIDL
jgi:hypothetical protein